LAFALHKTVEEIEQISSIDLMKCKAFLHVHPLDDVWARHAVLNANLQCCHGAKKWEPEKWLPRQPRKRQMSSKEIFAMIDSRPT
jgi:hypothetical protein